MPDRLRHEWEPADAFTSEELEARLEGREAELFAATRRPTRAGVVRDAHRDYAMPHPGIVLIAGNGERTTALPEVTAEMHGEYHFFAEQPLHDVYPGAGLGLGLNLRT